jgi:hypothetical protein
MPTGNEQWQRAIGDSVKVQEELIHQLPAADRTRLNDLLRQLVLVSDSSSWSPKDDRAGWHGGDDRLL